MQFRAFISLAFAVIAASLLVSSATDFTASAQVGSQTPEPGEGVLCSWAITAAIAEVGRKCHLGENPEFQAELDQSISRFDAYVLANSKPVVTKDYIEEFKRFQGHKDAPVKALCAPGDAEQMYQAMKRAGVAAIRKMTDELVARPGNPEWDTCL